MHQAARTPTTPWLIASGTIDCHKLVACHGEDNTSYPKFSNTGSVEVGTVHCLVISERVLSLLWGEELVVGWADACSEETWITRVQLDRIPRIQSCEVKTDSIYSLQLEHPTSGSYSTIITISKTMFRSKFCSTTTETRKLCHPLYLTPGDQFWAFWRKFGPCPKFCAIVSRDQPLLNFANFRFDLRCLLMIFLKDSREVRTSRVYHQVCTVAKKLPAKDLQSALHPYVHHPLDFIVDQARVRSCRLISFLIGCFNMTSWSMNQPFEQISLAATTSIQKFQTFI